MRTLQRFAQTSKAPMSWPKVRILLLLLLSFSTARQSIASDWVYTVRPGDNLWNLSDTYLADMRNWRKLQMLNRVKNPNLMPPGMLLRIPVAWLKVQPASVRILYVQGVASVQHTTGQQGQLAPGMQLVLGDTILTQASAGATLEFADGSRLLIQENSQLVFDTLTAYGKTGMVDTRMRLLNGRLESEVKPVQAPAGRFEVWTPAATSAVRGTHFRAAIGSIDNIARTEVTKGNIDVSASGATTAVNAGFGTVVKQDQPPPPPRPLLPAPNLAELPGIITTAAVHLTLPVLVGAVSYRVQLAQTERPDAPLWNRVYSGVEIDGVVLSEGQYLLKVRGIDDAGLEGMDALHTLAVDILPAAPDQLVPAADARLSTGLVQFQWRGPPAAASYLFQLAKTTDFAQPLFNVENITPAGWQLEHELAAGTYFWRIASVDQNGKHGVFGPAQRLLVEEPARLPQVVAVAVSANTATVSWQSVAAIPHYEVQLAYDAAFLDMSTVLRVQATQAQLPHPGVASFYLRVRYIDEAGQPGPYGPVHHVPVRYDALRFFGACAVLIGMAGL